MKKRIREEIEELVHLYVDGAFSRRDLFQRVAGVTGGAAAATLALEALLPSHVSAQEVASCPEDVRVPEDAQDLEMQIVEFPGEGGRLIAYQAIRRSEDPQPAVLVLHENRGLNSHILDVTRRVARAGYVALGIDLLSRLGGTAQYSDPAAASAALRNVTAAQQLEDMKSSLEYLKQQSFVRANRLGCVGFCMGGGNSFTLAVNSEDIAAAVVYYGTPPAADQLQRLRAPLLGIFAELDRGINGRLPALLTALTEQRKTYAMHIYEGVGHAFHNDTGAAYNRTASCDAWSKTLEFFGRHLRKADE